MARKQDMRHPVAAAVEMINAAVEDVVDTAKETVKSIADPHADPRGYVHESSRELGTKQGRGRLYYLIREWLPTVEPDMSQRRPKVGFITGSGCQHRSDRIQIPDGCQIVESPTGVPKVYSTHLGSAIKDAVMAGKTRDEAWSEWEEANDMRREDADDWHSYKSSRPGKKVQQVVYKDWDGSVRDPRDAKLS